MTEPTMAWSEAELARYPPVYVAMIRRQHQLSVERHYAKIEHARAEEAKKQKAKKKGKQ